MDFFENADQKKNCQCCHERSEYEGAEQDDSEPNAQGIYTAGGYAKESLA
jgi:hypothetical protein